MSSTRGDSRIGDRIQFRRRDGRAHFLLHDHLTPQFRRDKAVPVEGRCASEEAVIFLRVTLGHDPALPPSGRAAGPVAKARTRSIEGSSDHFCLSSKLQFGAFGKILDEADIECVGGLLQPKSPTAPAIICSETGMTSIRSSR